MEKLIISKELAEEIKLNEFHVSDSITGIKGMYYKELASLRDEHNFTTVYQVVAYLLGGQDKIYEVKKDPYLVIWNTEIKEFYTLPYNYQLAKGVEIVINTYDILEDAEETAEELNYSL